MSLVWHNWSDKLLFSLFSGVQDLDEVIKKSNYKKLQDDWQDVS